MDEFERADIAAQYAKVSAQIDQLTEVKDLLRGRLLEEGAGTRVAGNLRVQITENRRLNAQRFIEKYPVAEHPDYYEDKPKADMAKALHDDEVYDYVGAVVKVLN